MTTEQAVTIAARNGHAHCLMCGDRNPLSLGLRFRPNGTDEVRASFHAHPGLQGYDGILHGGVISALLDAAMTHCLFHRGVKAVTAELRVRFLCPVPCESILDLRAWVSPKAELLHRVKAELAHRGKVAARGEATFMQRAVTP